MRARPAHVPTTVSVSTYPRVTKATPINVCVRMVSMMLFISSALVTVAQLGIIIIIIIIIIMIYIFGRIWMLREL
jgi:hypothetical protein